MAMTSIVSEPGPSLEEILSRHGLRVTDLETECPRGIRDDIAVGLGTYWEMIGLCLEFSLDQLRDINRENSSQEMCRVALLDTWSKREGKGATFLKLARALHQQKRRDLVEVLCTRLKSTLSRVPVSRSLTSWDMPSGNDQQLQVLQRPLDSSLIGSPLVLDVSERIETLDTQFRGLHNRLLRELTKGGVTVDDLLQALTLLPFAFSQQYESTIQSMLPNLEKEEVVRKLFLRLNPLFTFIDFKLLQHLISTFGSPELKKDMTSYAENVQLFKKITTISELIDYWPGLDLPQIDHKMLRTKFDDDPKSYTLEKLDYFRNRFYSKLRLSEFVAVSILAFLKPANSFIAMWFLPTVVVPELIEAFGQMDSTFFQDEQMLEISLGDRMLYQRDISSKCMMSSIMKPQSTHYTHKGRPYNQEFYFHIQGGNRLNIARADAHPLWKDIPEVTSSYHTVQCARTTTLQNDGCINAEDIHKLKDKLKEFIEKEEAQTRRSRKSFRLEARFGHLFFIPTDHENGSNPVTTDTLKGMKFNKAFVTRLMGCTRETEAFKKEHCTCKVDANEITYKIRFILYGAELDGGRFDGVCYVKESVGKFTFLSAHESDGHTNEMKIDIIRPGRVYDIRVVCGVHNYDEEEVPDCVLATAEKIAKSMKRSSSLFDPEEIRLQMVGENFEVEYIREKKTCEYEWKNNPRWIFVEHDIRQLKYTKESRRILKRDGQFHPVPITFSHTDCRKEVELWSKEHSQPDLTNKWKAEELLDVNYFDKFVDSCFDIAGLLDGISAPTSTH